MPLGEISRPEAEVAVERHFGSLERLWFDRTALRHRPLATLMWLWRQKFEAAVLVCPDLGQPRLRLTSLLLGLARAQTYCRIDTAGRCQAWSRTEHLRRHGRPMLRHLAACALTLLFGSALLRLAGTCAGAPRSRRPSVRARRVLYLRAQLWLGLRGGGSVAHTAGVIGGLQQLGTEVVAVSSDRLPGVVAATRVVAPEVWFDGWLREVEDLAYNIAFLVGAWRTARTFRPDLIYQRHTAFNVAGAILSRALRVPLVLEYNSSEVWKGRYWGGLRLVRAAQLAERVNLRAAARVVIVSRVLRDELVAAGLPAERIVVNPNGVDPVRFRADRDSAEVRMRLGLGLAPNVVVGFSGTFGKWHGIPTLAEAVPLVLRSRPDVRWLIMGDGPLRPMLDAAVAGDSRVTCVGMVPHQRMPEYLAACDILVSPHGRQADGGEFFGSPTKLYEYMAVGRAIVASRVGQIAEVLEHEATALLVEPDDPQALADAIVRLVDNACLRARLGSCSRRAAEQRHTWRQNAERVLAALEAR